MIVKPIPKKVVTLRELRIKNRQCTLCSYQKKCTAPVPLAGNLASRIVFVGRDPGEQEDLQGWPFIGPSGDILKTACKQVGFNIWKECIITNAMKCRPENNIAPPIKQYRLCAQNWLNRELDIIDPAYIVLLGKEALKTVLPGVNLRSGETIAINGTIYAHLYHPSFWLKNGRMSYVKVNIIPFLKDWYNLWRTTGLLVRYVPEYVERKSQPSAY